MSGITEALKSKSDNPINKRNADNTAVKQNRKENRQEQSSSINSVIIFYSIFSKLRDKLRTCFSSFLICKCSSTAFRGSLTIETAIVLPLFVFMIFILLYPLKIMESERKLQNCMETVGKQLASAEYIESAGLKYLKGSEKYKDYSEIIDNAADGLKEGAGLALILVNAAAENTVRNAYFSADTSVFSSEENSTSAMFYAEMKYELNLPFSVFNIAPVQKSLVVNRRAWIGSAGGRGRSRYGEEISEEENEDDRIVYLGKTSVVYHDDPNCHYLSNVMLTADVSAMESIRNESGGKYHACPSCNPGKNGTVFYFESGMAYHSSRDCKAITAYSRAVHLSEAAGMPPCSYCGKGK